MKRIRDIGTHLPKVDPDLVAKALGAENVGKYHKWADIKHKRKSQDLPSPGSPAPFPEGTAKLEAMADPKLLSTDTGVLPPIAYDCIAEGGQVPIVYEFWSDGVIWAKLEAEATLYGEGHTPEEAANDLGDSIGSVIRLLAPYAHNGSLKEGTPAKAQWDTLSSRFDVNSYVGGYEDVYDDR